jgi:hypothetical protein
MGDTIVCATRPTAPIGPVRPLRESSVMSVTEVRITSTSTKRRRFVRGLAILVDPLG